MAAAPPTHGNVRKAALIVVSLIHRSMLGHAISVGGASSGRDDDPLPFDLQETRAQGVQPFRELP